MVPYRHCPLACVLSDPVPPANDVLLDVIDRGLTRHGYSWTTIRQGPYLTMPVPQSELRLVLKGTAIRA